MFIKFKNQIKRIEMLKIFSTNVLIRKSKRINFTYENISLITSQFFSISFFFLYNRI